jgi:hypothetical protein
VESLIQSCASEIDMKSFQTNCKRRSVRVAAIDRDWAAGEREREREIAKLAFSQVSQPRNIFSSYINRLFLAKLRSVLETRGIPKILFNDVGAF